MLIPIVIAATAGAIAWKKHKRKPLTAEEQTIFTQTLKDSGTLGPDKLKTMAKAYKTQGHVAQAKELEKRAALLSAPPAVQNARKAAFKKAMDSTDAAAVKKVAAAFHSVGHYEAASKLRNYAKGLLTHFPGAAKVKVSTKASVTGEEQANAAGED